MRLVTIFSLVFLLFACSEDLHYEQSVSIEESAWSYEDLISYSFEVADSEKTYDILLEVNHSPEFTYENFYVNIHTTFPSGEKVSDQVSIQLADELDQWQGRCSGSNCRTVILLQNKVKFKEVGRHEIQIEQYNRQDPLIGIHNLTLKIANVKL